MVEENPPSLLAEQREIVLELVEEDNDATLEQLCHRLEAKTGIKVSVPTMCRWLQRWGLTRKKKTLHASEAESLRERVLFESAGTCKKGQSPQIPPQKSLSKVVPSHW